VPIPGAGGEVKRQADGGFVISRLHEDVLEKLAGGTAGSYLRVTSAAADPAAIRRRIDRMEKRTLESQTLSTREERFQWPLASAVLALLLHLAVGPFRAQMPARKDVGSGLVPAREEKRRKWAGTSPAPTRTETYPATKAVPAYVGGRRIAR
jgi:hypothetical protein